MKRIKKYKKEITLIIYFICFSFFLLSFIIVEGDYFWHVKAGEAMFKNGILTKDIFSWSLKGKYWMSHEWLFEVIVYSLKLIFGNKSCIIYILVSLLLFYFLFYITNKNSLKKNILFSIIWISLSCIFMFFIQVRPHLLSYSLLLLTLFCLYDLLKNEDSNYIYFLPLITIFWANYHGGSSNLGYLLCLLFLIIGLFKFKFEKIEAKRLSKKQIKKYLMFGTLSILATCINVHGIRMLFYPYQNMLDTTMLQNISEWQPTVVNNISHYPFFILAIIILFIMLFSKKKIKFIDLVLFGFGLFLGLKSIRFWPYIYIMCSYSIFDYVGEVDYKHIYRFIIIGACALFVTFVLSIDMIFKSSSSSNFFVNKKMISIIKKENPKRLFNFYNTGGELIYNNVDVFIDGRADLYSEHGIYKDYLKINDARVGYNDLIDKYKFDCFLMDNNTRIYEVISNSDLYELVYYDKKNDMSLYKKIS